MPGLLDGLRVVEVALLAPNALGMHLADLGADVIKIEEPGIGDYTRLVGGAKKNGVSFLHLRWNRGKRSIALDLRHPDGAAVFRDLVGASEVVIEGLRAGALERRGLGYSDLTRVNPALVFCSVSGFGQTGPYRDLATHGVAYDAYAGHAPPETTPDGFPTIPARYTEIGTIAGPLYAAMAVVAAVLRARSTGEGCRLDVAQADAAVAWSAGRLDPVMSGTPRDERGPGSLAGAVRYQYYATSDGRYVLFQASERKFFENFCRAVGREDLLATEGADVGEHAVGDVGLRRELAGIFAGRTQTEWVRFFLHYDIPGGPVYAGAGVTTDPHFGERTRLVEHDHPVAGPVRLVGTPVRGDPDPAIDPAPAPETGQHTRAVLSSVLGYPEERIESLLASGAVAAPS